MSASAFVSLAKEVILCTCSVCFGVSKAKVALAEWELVLLREFTCNSFKYVSSGISFQDLSPLQQPIQYFLVLE